MNSAAARFSAGRAPYRARRKRLVLHQEGWVALFFALLLLAAAIPSLVRAPWVWSSGARRMASSAERPTPAKISFLAPDDAAARMPSWLDGFRSVATPTSAMPELPPQPAKLPAWPGMDPSASRTASNVSLDALTETSAESLPGSTLLIGFSPARPLFRGEENAPKLLPLSRSPATMRPWRLFWSPNAVMGLPIAECNPWETPAPVSEQAMAQALRATPAAPQPDFRTKESAFPISELRVAPASP